jgi:hypothetical protein
MFAQSNTDKREVRNYLPFRPMDVEISYDNSRYVYMLVSLRDNDSIYIGWTTNLYRRFNEHNQGLGSHITSNPELRPWAIVAYVTGFDDELGDTPSVFEAAWKHHIQHTRANTVDSMASVAKSLCNSEKWKDCALRYIQCGTFTGSTH